MENICLDSGYPEDFPGLPQFPQANSEKIPEIDHYHFLARLFKFVITISFSLSNTVTCAV
jgi:hypothetical protein